jgi:glutamate N-acetyltransferase/amino-acid N-acetyltransferase
MFTTSAVAAPPVRVCQERLAASRTVRSIVVNSGNANALTGKQGRRDAETMVARLEERCGGPGLVLSTGVIGVPLPIDRVLAGIDAASAELSPQNEKVSRAILTTDTGPKTVAVSVETEGGRFTVGGIAKGSGMIHPNMATMLAVIATDAPIDPVALKTILARAVDRSFHEISVDGDTSTNDAVLLLAGQPSPTADVDLDVLEAAITHVARDLASQIVRDGEGVSRVMEIEVHSAKSPDEARSVAESIARSSLVKTALAGGDPNWGRILSAAGASGAPISPSGLTLELGDHVVFEKGAVVSADERELAETFAADEVSVRLGLGRGDALARMVTTDLTRRYVEINSEYTT